MKLLRYGQPGEEKPGILDMHGIIRDISAYVDDLTSFSLNDVSWIHKLKTLDITQLPKVDKNTRIGACLGSPGKLVCIGFNSRMHAKEMGLTLHDTEDMVIFIKANTSICGAFDPILHTPHTKKLDWEAELGVVIGKKGKYIPKNRASDYIFGYTCINDLSERYLQFETSDKQFTKGKCFDNAAPLGPYLVIKDEVPDSGNLQIKLWVNGELRQNFNTCDYIHNVEEVICYLSQYFTLYPGDIVSMGSAPGSALAWGENQFLKPDDRVVLCIEGLGQQEQVVIVE
jgi:2-keto-4-pentenoate hydratase/2-oxohepta-3-ene-1,7-dioic acid hydratase in catechol pathway